MSFLLPLSGSRGISEGGKTKTAKPGQRKVFSANMRRKIQTEKLIKNLQTDKQADSRSREAAAAALAAVDNKQAAMPGKWTQVQPQQVAAMLLLPFAAVRASRSRRGGRCRQRSHYKHYKKCAISPVTLSTRPPRPHEHQHCRAGTM